MYHPFFVCIWLKNSIFGEFSNIYLLSAQNRVKWRHKIRPIAKNSGRFWFFLHETTPNWCPERCAKFHVDTVVNEEVIPEKPRGGVGSDPPPPPRRWRVNAAIAKLGDLSNRFIVVLWCHLVKIIMVAPWALFERHVWSFSCQRHT